jgi:beta-lactamase class A
MSMWIRSWLALVLLAGSAAPQRLAAAIPTAKAPEPAWTIALRAAVEAADARFAGEIGVYVHHLGRDEAFSYRADEPWYLASGVKVPVAIAVLREVERGGLSLDARVRLEESDFVDGAGSTNSYPAGATLPVSFLMDQMIRYSDNTASDVLIRTVGLDQVNRVANELLVTHDLTITSLSDVRRRSYGMLHASASALSSRDLLTLRRAGAGPARMQRLALILGVPAAEFLQPDLDSAFEAYYATHVNTARLSDFGRMLATLSSGLALKPEGSAYLLGLMADVRTGDRRIKARLPPGSRFAHKTGTQHRRLCDMGIVTTPVGLREERVVVAACARGSSSPAASERALRDIGAALTASGVLMRPTPGS